MVGIVVVTRAALLIARRASTWTVDEHLAGQSPGCVAVDLSTPAQVYCGTARAGLFRSRDSGRNWEPAGPGIDHPMITAVDVGHAEKADGFGVVYAGTEPSAVFRSDNGGDDEETSRLCAAWHKPDATQEGDELEQFLTLEHVKELDVFDRAQLVFVIRVCRRSRSLSEAGRTLFGASRTRKSLSNDADRLRKYLARFGLEFSKIHSIAHLPALATH